MAVIILLLIILASIALIGIVILQNPKGSGLNSTFGSAQAATQFLGGAANAGDVLEKITFGLTAFIFIACLLSSFLF